MDDPNQIEVPPSFTALFTAPSGYKLTQPMSFVRERYEMCEDLAQALTEQAATQLFKSGRTEGEVLAGIRAALSVEGSPVAADEALWVARRLAELLGWEMPAD
jgi:hypothetical protein